MGPSRVTKQETRKRLRMSLAVLAAIALIAGCLALWWWLNDGAIRERWTATRLSTAKPSQQGTAFPWHLASSAPTPTDPEDADDLRREEICGLGVTGGSKAAWREAQSEIHSAERRASQGRVAKWRANPDLYAQALALLWPLWTLQHASAPQDQASFDAAMVAHEREWIRLNQVIAPQVVQLAHTADNPALYALIARFCDNGVRSACQNLNVARWAELEPRNAAAHLALANRLRSTNPSAADSVLLLAAEAPALDTHETTWWRHVLDTAPSDPLGRAVGSHQAVSAWVGNVAGGVSLYSHCAARVITSQGQGQIQSRNACLKLVELIADNPKDASTAMQAIGVAGGFGKRNAKLEQQRDWLHLSLQLWDAERARLGGNTADTLYLSCADSQFMRNYISGLATMGELENYKDMARRQTWTETDVIHRLAAAKAERVAAVAAAQAKSTASETR